MPESFSGRLKTSKTGLSRLFPRYFGWNDFLDQENIFLCPLWGQFVHKLYVETTYLCNDDLVPLHARMGPRKGEDHQVEVWLGECAARCCGEQCCGYGIPLAFLPVHVRDDAKLHYAVVLVLSLLRSRLRSGRLDG